jgi:hypothetical protein
LLLEELKKARNKNDIEHEKNLGSYVNYQRSICTTGNNSPAARPEFVDISLNATTGQDGGGLPDDGGVDEEEE